MKVLFLCVANSARSQIAEGLAKSILNDRVEIHSAGSKPSGEVHQDAIRVMEEFGIDIAMPDPAAVPERDRLNAFRSVRDKTKENLEEFSKNLKMGNV